MRAIQLLGILPSDSLGNGEDLRLFRIRNANQKLRNFVIIESRNITVDNIKLTAHSDDYQV